MMGIKREETFIPQAISIFGLFLIFVILAEALYVLFVSNPLGTVWIAGLATSLPFTLGIIYTGNWLRDSFVPVSRYKRVGLWGLGGLGIFSVVNVAIMLTMWPDSTLQLVSWGRWAVTLGAGVGLLIGVFEARSIERAVQAERERVRADEAEAKEELLSYLNATLRHEVLNTATIIVGHANLALSEYESKETVTDSVETIKFHTQEMEAVIEDVRLLLQATTSETETNTVDVTNLLTEEIGTIQETHSDVTIETSLPEHAFAQANKPLRRAFANILWNAVEHNDNETPRIEVTVDRGAENITICIEDNGPGISESEMDTLFQQEIRHDDKHGLGLTLTQTLINSYGGTLDVPETGPDGTVFKLTLPRATEVATAGGAQTAAD
jgi:signal transduction histidine kinase